MFMRHIALIILTLLSVLSARALTGEQIVEKANTLMAMDESCIDVVDNHIILLDFSEAYLAEIVKKQDNELVSADITLLQKVLKARYDHLVKVLAKFHSPKDCASPGLADMLAVYDFNLLASNTMSDVETRRMIHSFTKADDYGMDLFKTDYKYYTNHSTIKKIRKNLTSDEVVFLEFFGLKIEKVDELVSFSTTGDKLKRIWNWTLGKGLVRTWGNISDTLKVRQGYLKDDLEVRAQIERQLKPLDLLFEKRTFVLSNYTIPGYWGHVAIWLGTKEQLKKLGLWDRPELAVFQKEIEQGRSVVQMRKEGVVFNTLEEFMNLDDMAVMRVKAIKGKERSVYSLLSDNLNKEYDFSFDAKSLGKITCTELVTFTYGKIHWPSHVQMGRLVISPDDVARLSLQPDEAELIAYVYGQDKKPIFKREEDWKKLLAP